MERRRRPTVSDGARPTRILVEMVAVDRAWFSRLRPSASRYAPLDLPIKGTEARFELRRGVRVPWRRCWPVGKSPRRYHQRGDHHKRGHQTTFTHFLSPLLPTPCQRQPERTPVAAPKSTVPEEPRTSREIPDRKALEVLRDAARHDEPELKAEGDHEVETQFRGHSGTSVRGAMMSGHHRWREGRRQGRPGHRSPSPDDQETLPVPHAGEKPPGGGTYVSVPPPDEDCDTRQSGSPIAGGAAARSCGAALYRCPPRRT